MDADEDAGNVLTLPDPLHSRGTKSGESKKQFGEFETAGPRLGKQPSQDSTGGGAPPAAKPEETEQPESSPTEKEPPPEESDETPPSFTPS